MAERDGIHHSEHWGSQFVEHTGTLLEEELRNVAGHLERAVPTQPLPRSPAANDAGGGFRMSLAESLHGDWLLADAAREVDRVVLRLPTPG